MSDEVSMLNPFLCHGPDAVSIIFIFRIFCEWEEGFWLCDSSPWQHVESQCQHQAHTTVPWLANKTGENLTTENLNKATPTVLDHMGCVLQPLWLCYVCWELGTQEPNYLFGMGVSQSLIFKRWPAHQCLCVLGWAFLSHSWYRCTSFSSLSCILHCGDER